MAVDWWENEKTRRMSYKEPAVKCRNVVIMSFSIFMILKLLLKVLEKEIFGANGRFRIFFVPLEADEITDFIWLKDGKQL